MLIYYFLFVLANINDRSLLGDRDSELAVCVQDEKTVSPADKKNCFLSFFSLSLSLSLPLKILTAVIFNP